MTELQKKIDEYDKELQKNPNNALFGKAQHYIIDNLGKATFEDILSLFKTKRLVFAGIGEILSNNVSSIDFDVLKKLVSLDNKSFKDYSPKVFPYIFTPFKEEAKKAVLKKEAATLETKTPDKKKTEFKESVLKKLFILENGDEDREEKIKETLTKKGDDFRTVRWFQKIGDLFGSGSKGIDDFFASMVKYGDSSEIPQVQAVKEYFDNVNTVKSVVELENYVAEFAKKVMPITQLSALVYRIMRKYILSRKSISLEELTPIINERNDISFFLEDVLSVMLERKMFFNEKEILLTRNLLEKNKLNGRVAKVFKSLVDASAIDLIKDRTTNAPKKPKMNIKENEEFENLSKRDTDLSWDAMLNNLMRAEPRSGMGYSEMEEELRGYYNDYIDTNLATLTLGVLLKYIEKRSRPFGLFFIMLEKRIPQLNDFNKSFRADVLKDETIHPQKDEMALYSAPIKRFLATAKAQFERDEGVKKTNEKETAKPKARKMNIKESKETWADKLIGFEHRMISADRGSIEYKQAIHEAINFVIKNLRHCTVDDFVDLGYCYDLMLLPQFRVNVAGMLGTLKPEVREGILKLKKEDEVGISNHIWSFQKQIRDEDEKKELAKENPTKPKAKKTLFKENKFERMFDYLRVEVNG